MKDIYRKSVLERLSSPEQLDKAIKITSPMSWLVLLAIALIVVATVIWAFNGTLPVTITANAIIAAPSSTNTIYTDVSGRVTDVAVKPRSAVRVGDRLITVQSNAGNIDVLADQTGIISEVLVSVGGEITQNSEVVRISPVLPDGTKQVVVCYVPYASVKNIKRGMRVYINLSNADSQKYGHMEARVVNIDSKATTGTAMGKVLGNDNSLSASFSQNGAVSAVTCEIYPDKSTVSGYFWSNERGAKLNVDTGSLCVAKIITEEQPPIAKLITKINEIVRGD